MSIGKRHFNKMQLTEKDRKNWKRWLDSDQSYEFIGVCAAFTIAVYVVVFYAL